MTHLTIGTLRKIKKAYYKIKKLLGFNIENPERRHFLNLKNNQVAFIDGKPFVKINLRFVDTLDSEATKYLENLEEEIDSLRQEINKLDQTLDENINKNKSLEALNINLYGENKLLEIKFKTEIKKNQIPREGKENLLKLQEEITKQNLANKEHKDELKRINIILMQKDNELVDLTDQINKYQATIEAIPQKGGSPLKVLLKEYKKKLAEKNETINQKDTLIKTLNEKIKENETTLKELRKQKIHYRQQLLKPIGADG